MAKPPAHLGYVTPAVVISAVLLSLQTVFSGGVGNEFAWASAKVIILSCFNMPRFEVQDVQGRPCGPAALAAF